MPRTATSPVLQLIRRVLEGQHVQQLTDQELLRRFGSEWDEAAFHSLLRRHGPMVLDVCRNVLGNEADAEDAFQATFLTLAQKAGAIRNQASIGSWLYGVAYRTALKAQAAAARRQKHEARVPPPRPAEGPDDLTWREVRQILHAELSGLSERHRAPLVLCYLEGRTQDEAAAALGVSRSTVNKRLERARGLLRARLARRGLGSLALVVAATRSPAAAAHLRPALVSSTARAAVALAAGHAAQGLVPAAVLALMEGGLRAVSLLGLKAATAALLLAALLAVGLSAAPDPALGQQPGKEGRASTPRAVPPVSRPPAQPGKERAVTYVDLQPKANQRLKESFHKFDGNNLAELKPGKQTLGGLKFDIGEGLIQLANDELEVELPEKVTGIKVGAKFARMHILQATGYSVDDGTVIARYIVHYADKSTRTIEVVYGKDVRDWWRRPDDQEPTRARVAWEGSNRSAKLDHCSLWLFAVTWKNPDPDKTVVSIDYVSALTAAAPFVVALTLEGEGNDGPPDPAPRGAKPSTGARPQPMVEAHTQGLTGVASSPNGKRLVSMGRDHSVRVITMRTGHEILTLGTPQGEEVSVVLSPDGKVLAAAVHSKGKVSLWVAALPRRAKK
jgi:RNA polymerase sigma factor (sigma-70 family)